MTTNTDIPEELRRLNQWVCWSDRDGTKKPLQPTGKPASSTKRETWGEWVVCDRVKSQFSGLGFVFAADGDLFGVDLDGCIGPDGTIEDWACDVIRLFGTYCEFSPSGTGVHIIGRGRLPDGKGRNRKIDEAKVCDKNPGVEVYDRGRYFTFTGQMVGDCNEVTECQSKLEVFLELFWPAPEVKTYSADNITPQAKQAVSVVKRARSYLATIPPAVSGAGGHNVTFYAACVLVLGFDLPPETAIGLLVDWNQKCSPPWSDRDLWHKLNDANKRECTRGYLLKENGHYDGTDVDLRSLLANLLNDAGEEVGSMPPCPRAFPVNCLEVPGLIGDIVEHNLATSMFPQPELALAGAIALMAVVTGGKVVDRFGTRTNSYVLGIAPSGAGKDHARKLNAEILIHAGGEDLIGEEAIASSAGLISSVSEHPAILFQLDEIGRLLATMQDAKRSPHLYNIGTVLMKLYTSSGSIWKSDAYADRKKNRTIKYPHCCILGTAVPEGFWTSLSADNLSDGLLSRFMVFESMGYVLPVTPKFQPIDSTIIDRVRHWLELKTNGGNLNRETAAAHPLMIQHTPEAFERAFNHLQEICRRRINEDSVPAAVWSRTSEKTNKLALLFACSRAEATGELPMIDLTDVERAIKISNWLTRKMLHQSGLYVARNDHEAQTLRVLRLIHEQPMTKNEIVRRTQWLRKRDRDEVLQTLVEGGSVEVVEEKTEGRTAVKFVRKG